MTSVTTNIRRELWLSLWWIAQPLFCSILSVERGLSMYSLLPDHFKASTVGDQIISPHLKFWTQPTAKSFPIHTWQRHLKLSINQNQHLLQFKQVLSSLYSEAVQFADFLNVRTPPKWYFHALPLLALPPLKNYLWINHNSFTSFKMYILFLFKAQTMSEEVLWVKVLCCLKWVHPWPVPQWKLFPV